MPRPYLKRLSIDQQNETPDSAIAGNMGNGQNFVDEIMSHNKTEDYYFELNSNALASELKELSFNMHLNSPDRHDEYIDARSHNKTNDLIMNVDTLNSLR